jgi:SAM-dependent methyltransferase
MEACAIPFRQAFDVVGAFDVLEHIDDDKKALKELCATVRSGGGLVLTVPQHAFLWSAWDGMNRHKRRYAVWELEKMVENEGFKILCSTSFASLLMPLFIARRMAERHKTEMSFADGARINPLVNLVCAAVMVLERGLIYSGLRLPFGGSSLVIARKPGELTA